MQCSISGETKGLIRSIEPMPEAIFLDSLSIWLCHAMFSSIRITSDLVVETCFIGTLSIESSRDSDIVLRFCLEPVFRVSLLQRRHWFVDVTTGRPPSVSGRRCWLKSEQRYFVIYRRNTYEQYLYGAYNLFQNAEFKANFSIKVCFKFCILEQIIGTVLFICISSII